MRAVRDDPALRAALASALDACRRGLVDYQAGLLDDAELRQVLVHAGLVHRGDEAWLLDLEAGRWRKYDGLAVGASGPPLSSVGVGRMQLAIDRLASELTRTEPSTEEQREHDD